MKTVIRNDKSEITHLHYYGKYYLTNADDNLVRETSITTEMINRALKEPISILKRIINDDGDTPETMKVYIMMKNGFGIVLYDHKGDAIDIKLQDL